MRDGPWVLKVGVAMGWMPPLKLVLKLEGTKGAVIHRCTSHPHWVSANRSLPLPEPTTVPNSSLGNES